MSPTDPLVARLCRYIDVPSISGGERGFLEVLEGDFRALGYRIERQEVAPDRWNLLALPAAPLESPDVVFCTHVDVVPPHIPARIDDGRVFGRGACDTKGGLVAMMAAADRLDPERRRVGFLLVVGEEVDHVGAETARALDLRPRAIVLCEPTEGRLVTGQKGLLKVALSSRGEAAHSAFPELGRDALGPLLDSLQRLRKADYPTHPVLGETTLNIGLLSAGIAANITPPFACAELMYRAVSDPQELLGQVAGLCEPSVTVEHLSSNPPLMLNRLPGFQTTHINFNTDAFYLQSLAPVYLLGPGDIRTAHGDDEHIDIDALRRGVETYVRLVEAAEASA